MLKNRPFTFFGVSLGAGIVTGLFFALPTLLLISLIIVSAVLAFVFMKRREKYIFIALLGICIGFIYSSLYCNKVEGDSIALCGEEITFNALVQNISPYYSDSELSLTITECEKANAIGKRFLMVSDNEAVTIGDTVTCTATFKEATVWDKADSIYLKADGEILEILTTGTPDFKGVINSLRMKISERIGEIFSPRSQECAAFFRAVLIGDRSEIDSTVTAKFARAGISHLLAISGLHFTVVVATLYNLLFLLTGRKRLCSGFAIIFAIIYAILCGASPSVVRAAFMCCFAFGTQIFMFKNDSFHSLALALLALLFFNPYSALSLSLQLSFLSCVGVLFISPFINRGNPERKLTKVIKVLICPLLFSIGATVASLPVLFYNFDFISVSAPIANIAVSLLATPILFIGVLCLLISTFWLGAAQFLAYIPFMLHRLLMEWIGFFASSQYACVSVHIQGISYTVAISLIAMVSSLFVKAKNAIKIIATCFCLIVVIIGVSCELFSRSLQVNTFIKYKDSNSATLLVVNSEGSALFDLGGKSSLSSFAVESGFTHVDYYFVASYSEDSVLRTKRSLSALSVNTLVLPPKHSSSYTNSAFNEILLLADANDCDIIFFSTELAFNDNLSVFTGSTLDLQDSFALTVRNPKESVLIFDGKEPLSKKPSNTSEHLIVSKDTASNSQVLLGSLPEFVGNLYHNQKSNVGSGLGAIINLCEPHTTKTFKTTFCLRIYNDGTLKILN